jgi:hypothetical protein
MLVCDKNFLSIHVSNTDKYGDYSKQGTLREILHFFIFLTI